MFSFGSDGASVMTGRRTGVATRLRAHNPEMMSLHCSAHPLALASSQAAEGVAYMKSFSSHLVTLYYHIANSPVREAVLHEIQQMMEEPVLHVKKAIYTRWLSHDKAVTAISRGVEVLCYWSQECGAKIVSGAHAAHWRLSFPLKAFHRLPFAHYSHCDEYLYRGISFLSA